MFNLNFNWRNLTGFSVVSLYNTFVTQRKEGVFVLRLKVLNTEFFENAKHKTIYNKSLC